MKPHVNCIEKYRVFIVRYSKNSGIIFTFFDGQFRIDKGGKITKLKSD
nr:DUF943 family protein [Pantoea agglomerans]